METAREDIIKVTHLNKQFLVNKQPMEVLHDINLQVKKGEFITIVGHSGCGESKKTSGTCRIGRTRKQLSKPVVRRYVTACRNCQRAGKQSDDSVAAGKAQVCKTEVKGSNPSSVILDMIVFYKPNRYTMVSYITKYLWGL